MARPSEFNEEIAAEICERIATKPRGLNYICDNDPDLPCARTVQKWLSQQPAFVQNYLRARERQADLLFDQSIEIADDGTGDTKTVGAPGFERDVMDTEWVARSKLRVDTRLRMAGKLAPKKYGDKIAHVGGNPDTDQPIQLGVVIEPGEAYRRLIKGEG